MKLVLFLWKKFGVQTADQWMNRWTNGGGGGGCGGNPITRATALRLIVAKRINPDGFSLSDNPF